VKLAQDHHVPLADAREAATCLQLLASIPPRTEIDQTATYDCSQAQMDNQR
jgi:hypothetical protein